MYLKPGILSAGCQRESLGKKTLCLAKSPELLSVTAVRAGFLLGINLFISSN